MLIILTPSTGRPFAFSCLEHYVRHQKCVLDFRWLVAGEDHTGYAFTMGQEIIRTKPDPKLHSICVNYLAMMAQIERGMVLCLEDDDHYAPSYFATMVSGLLQKPLVGLAPAKYYHLPSRRWGNCGNRQHASLCATGFTTEVFPYFKMACNIGNPVMDIWLWCHWSQTLGQPASLLSNDDQQIGLKGVDGSGIGTGHTYLLPHQDLDGSVLRSWIGQDADLYFSGRFRDSS